MKLVGKYYAQAFGQKNKGGPVWLTLAPVDKDLPVRYEIHVPDGSKSVEVGTTFTDAVVKPYRVPNDDGDFVNADERVGEDKEGNAITFHYCRIVNFGDVSASDGSESEDAFAAMHQQLETG